MADVDGNEATRAPFGGGEQGGRPLSVITLTSGLPDPIRTYYKMSGWNTTWGAPEIWVVVGAPSTTPPVGPCVNIEVAATWDA